MPRSRTPAHDPRLDTIPALIEDKKIMTLGDIFHFFPRTSAAHLLQIERKQFDRLLLEPLSFTLQQIYDMADLFQVSREIMIDLVRRHAREVKKGGWDFPELDYKGRE